MSSVETTTTTPSSTTTTTTSNNTTSNNSSGSSNNGSNGGGGSSGTAGPGGGNTSGNSSSSNVTSNTSNTSSSSAAAGSGAAVSSNNATAPTSGGSNNGSNNNSNTTNSSSSGSSGSSSSATTTNSNATNATAASSTVNASAAAGTTTTTATTAAGGNKVKANSGNTASAAGASASAGSTSASNSASSASSSAGESGAASSNAVSSTTAPSTTQQQATTTSTAASTASATSSAAATTTTTAIKLTTSSAGNSNGTTNSPVTSLGCSTAIAITTSNAAAAATTSASIRAIGAGGQSTQVRVVMPTSMMVPSMIKQLENAGGRTQITAFPAQPVPRTISNTSITVTRPVTQTTYLPRASVTAAQMTGVTAAGQRLVTPVRAATGATITGAGTTVTGLTTAGSFVRGTAVSRNTASPGTTVISPATNTTWMTANTGQVQLIRTIPQPTRQRIITTQGITTVGAGALVGGGNGASTVTTVSGAVAVAAGGSGGAGGGNPSGQNQSGGQQPTIQIVSSPTSVAAHVSQQQQQQQTYVATLSTVLPQRQHQATLVYSSNVAGATAQAISQAQQFNPAVATTQRFAVATPLTTTTVGGAGAPRQIRPIPLAKSFSTAKLNTTSISIRAPNLPQLTPTIATSVALGGAGVVTGAGGAIATIAGTASNSPRSTAVTGPTASVIPTTNLSTTRIIQLQQPPSGTTQQIISSTGRLTGNVMLQPIIVNTSAGGKIGIRPPVTMATKVQPSLTITQLGISKLPQATATGNAGNAAGGNSAGGGGSGSASPSISASAAASVATNLTTTATAAQLLSAQQIVSSAAATATVVPLAITTRGANGSTNILTGTITPIKNANGITVGKVMTPAATATVVAVSTGGGTIIDATTSSASSSNATSATTTSSSSPATSNVYIHQRPNASIAVSSVAGGPTTVLSTTGTPTSSATTATAFLAPGTIYYESVPASSVQVSTGVLSLTTTTVTSSTLTSSAGNLTAINTLPFVSNAANGATFTVVPSTGGRTIGQLQLPVSTAAGAQLAAVPVRFSTQLSADGQAKTGTAATAHLVSSQQLIMPVPTSVAASQAQMVIPLQTSIKVSSASGNGGGTAGAGGGSGGGNNSAITTATAAAIVPNFLRKRDGAEVSGLRAAKNLGPTLLSMSSASHSSSGAGSPVSVSNVCYSINSAPSSGGSGGGPFSLTVEALAKKERAAAAGGGGGNGGSCATIVSSSTRSSRVASPASSDGGSTTVSAHSSPGVDQQMQDGNMIINRMTVANDNMHFNPINELYANHPSVTMQHQLPSTSGSSRNSSLDQQQHQQMHGSPTPQRLNGAMGPIDCPPRKKSRRSTNDSQQSVHSQTSLNLPPPASLTNPLGVQLDGSQGGAISCVVPMAGMVGCGGLGVVCHGVGGSMVSGDLLMAATSATQMHGDGLNLISHNHNMIPSNKENAKPTEYVLRRPRNCTLLNGYKQTGKITNNHFQRYSDVKPRKPNPSVIDLANQPNILAKINGWKIYHLQSQMMDLCDDENTGYEKLSEMLKSMETHEQNQDIERICDLLKGNMQRSKIIVDGVNEAQNQIMKIFDHKTHVSDIINRCASKRNFKKRDKV